MNTATFFSTLLLTLLINTVCFGDTPHTYLEGRVPRSNGRYKTFCEALRMLEQREAAVIVETGTERWQDASYCFDGDGGSTIIFAHWAKAHNASMFSVDINETHIAYCLENTIQYQPYLQLVHGDSVSFLQNFPLRIDFLYLDSYDYDQNYPLAAQNHCLNEVLAAEDKLHPDSFIMIDDCNIPGGGKGKLAIEYLLSRGWRLHQNKHQVILVKNR